jgi:hypothetical protein
MEPLFRPQGVQHLAERGATAFAMELIPRITRAQSMDALSSMATVAGYKAVLLAAHLSPRMFPLLMSAAGTVSPARVFVIGAGVAGLQAMATAKRLGAAVSGYDVRPATRDQVESVGAKFVELPLQVEQAEAAGGYARALEEETLRRQQDLLGEQLVQHEVVITTAAVPGKRAPLLIPAPRGGGDARRQHNYRPRRRVGRQLRTDPTRRDRPARGRDRCRRGEPARDRARRRQHALQPQPLQPARAPAQSRHAAQPHARPRGRNRPRDAGRARRQSHPPARDAERRMRSSRRSAPSVVSPAAGENHACAN